MATRVWAAGSNGGADGDWNNPLNWTGDTLPVNGDDVQFNNSSQLCFIGATSYVLLNSLTIAAGSAEAAWGFESSINSALYFPYKVSCVNLNVGAGAQIPILYISASTAGVTPVSLGSWTIASQIAGQSLPGSTEKLKLVLGVPPGSAPLPFLDISWTTLSIGGSTTNQLGLLYCTILSGNDGSGNAIRLQSATLDFSSAPGFLVCTGGGSDRLIVSETNPDVTFYYPSEAAGQISLQSTIPSGKTVNTNYFWQGGVSLGIFYGALLDNFASTATHLFVSTIVATPSSGSESLKIVDSGTNHHWSYGASGFFCASQNYGVFGPSVNYSSANVELVDLIFPEIVGSSFDNLDLNSGSLKRSSPTAYYPFTVYAGGFISGGTLTLSGNCQIACTKGALPFYVDITYYSGSANDAGLPARLDSVPQVLFNTQYIEIRDSSYIINLSSEPIIDAGNQAFDPVSNLAVLKVAQQVPSTINVLEIRLFDQSKLGYCLGSSSTIVVYSYDRSLCALQFPQLLNIANFGASGYAFPYLTASEAHIEGIPNFYGTVDLYDRRQVRSSF